MGNNAAKQQSSSGVAKVVINYQTCTIEEVHKVDGTIVTEGDVVEIQKNIINQHGGIACFVEQQYAGGMEQLISQAIEIKNQLHECSYLRGEISRVIKTHVVEIVRSVHLFLHFYEKGYEARWEAFSQIAFSEIKQMKKKLQDIQEHLEMRTKENSIPSFFTRLLRNIKLVLRSTLGGDVKFIRNHILYVIKQLTAHAHLRNQLSLLTNKINNVMDPTTKVEQGLINLHSAKKNEMAKHFYLPILKKHNVLLEGLLRAECFEVESVEKIIKGVEDDDNRQLLTEAVLETDALKQASPKFGRLKTSHQRTRSKSTGAYDVFSSTNSLDISSPNPAPKMLGGNALCFSVRA